MWQWLLKKTGPLRGLIYTRANGTNNHCMDKLDTWSLKLKPWCPQAGVNLVELTTELRRIGIPWLSLCLAVATPLGSLWTCHAAGGAPSDFARADASPQVFKAACWAVLEGALGGIVQHGKFSSKLRIHAPAWADELGRDLLQLQYM